MSDLERKVTASGDVVLVMDNKDYLKEAPEGFKEVVDYITSSNEANKEKAVDLAVAEFKKDKKVSNVKVRIPCGSGKLDNLELGFQRERSFVDVKNKGKKITFAYMGQKPKTRLLGNNVQMKEVKERFKTVMAKI